MSSPTLRVGEPAWTGGPPLPIEGARLLLDGPRIRLLLGYHDPTESEIHAVRSAAVELGIFHDDGVAAVAARIGEADGRWIVEACAPLILLDADAHVDNVRAESHRSAPPDTYPATLALCDSEDATVRALRHLHVPASVVHAARRAAHAQAARFESVAAAIRVHERALRYRTVGDLMHASAVQARIEP